MTLVCKIALTYLQKCRTIKEVQSKVSSMDFSNISDDQLLQLIKAVMAEAVSRGGAIARAASDVYVDAETELRIKAEAAETARLKAETLKLEKLKAAAEAEIQKEEALKVQEQQAIVWAQKIALVQAIKEDPLFADDEDFTINIWARGNDIRVYLQEGGVYDRKHKWEVIYYFTGNKFQAPHSIEGLNDEDAERFRPLFQLICKYYRAGFKVNLKDCLKGGIPADDRLLKKYKAAIQPSEVLV